MKYDKLDLIQSKAENLLRDLKEDTATSYVTNALLVLVIMYLISLVILYITDVNSSIIKFLIYLLVMIICLVVYRMRMTASVKESQSLADYEKMDKEDKANYISGQLKYLSSGYNIKIIRLQSVRLIYVIAFPLLLVLLSELYQYFFGDGDIDTSIMQFILAFIIGSSFWFFYFQNDIREFEMDRDDVDRMVSTLYS